MDAPKKILLGLLLLWFGANITLADTVALRADHPERYVVVKGDTLWDIAERFLKDPWVWPEIWQVNPQIANPHLIYPGDTITLVWVNGRPELRLERGHPTVKLSPQVRESRIDTAIPTIPIDAIRQFLNGSRVVGKEELDNAAYIVAAADEHVMSGAGDRVYVRKVNQNDNTKRYTVFRATKPYHDPGSNEVIGYEALYIGDAVVEASGDPTTMKLERTSREAITGDRLLPITQQEILHHYQPHPPKQPVRGQIISVIDGVTQIGQYQVVVLNLGEREGIEAGHVVAVYQTGETIRDVVSEAPDDTVKLPNERAGIAMVFRTFQRVSYALVMNATRPIHLHDTVRNP